MNYSYEQLEKDIEAINRKLAGIRKDRGKRYGSAADTLANVREADPKKGWRGAYVHAVECLSRLENMFDEPVINAADFDNATDDLINYAYYIKILGKQQKYHWKIDNPLEYDPLKDAKNIPIPDDSWADVAEMIKPKPLTTCAGCGQDLTHEAEKMIDGDYYCHRCYDGRMVAQREIEYLDSEKCGGR